MNKPAKCTVCKKTVEIEKTNICVVCDVMVCDECAQTEGQHLNATEYICETCIGRAFRCRNCND